MKQIHEELRKKFNRKLEKIKKLKLKVTDLEEELFK